MSADLGQLRAKVHVLDKFQQDGTPIKRWRLNHARALYLRMVEGQNQLSADEDAWCKRVLFGEVIPEPAIKQASWLTMIIRARRSTRRWTDAITDDEFIAIVDAARWAPSGCNRQPCEFLIVRDQDKITSLARIKGQPFIAKAPSCILAFVDLDVYNSMKAKEMLEYFCYMDAGAAIENLLLAGAELGLGLCWVNACSDDQLPVRKLFGIEANYRLVALIPAGHPAGLTKAPGRKDIQGMCHFENWHSHSPSHS